MDRFDKNLSIGSAMFGDDIVFYDITKKPFRIFGNCPQAENLYARMPEKIAQGISAGVANRAARSAGVRLRFRTNTEKIGLKVHFKKYLQFPAQSALSTRGFDIYADGEYCASLIPPENSGEYYEQLVDIGAGKDRQITIYFPYNAVIDTVLLGLDRDAVVAEAEAYTVEAPIVFYGSSITHGFCVSRPGNIFSAMVCRRLDADYRNLGFAGVCRGEPEMAEYLVSVNKSVFVCGYDHNEEYAADLQAKHLAFYQKYREYDKESPIVFVSSPNRAYRGQRHVMHERMKIVEQTYQYALEHGDAKVYFVNGQTIYPDEIAFDCLADGIHPNDLGAHMIAEKLYETLKNVLEKQLCMDKNR